LNGSGAENDQSDEKAFDYVHLDESNTSLVDLNQTNPDESLDQSATADEFGETGLNESGFFDEIDLNAIPDLTDTSNTIKPPTTPAAPSMITVAKSTLKSTPIPAPPPIKNVFTPIPPPNLPAVTPVPVSMPVPVTSLLPGVPQGPTQISTFTPVAPMAVSHPISIPTQKTSFVPNVFNSAAVNSTTNSFPSIGDRYGEESIMPVRVSNFDMCHLDLSVSRIHLSALGSAAKSL
jgi:hypothetical protein